MGENRNIFGRIKASFHSRKFKGGAYATGISAVVVILVIIANLLVSELNVTIDMTANSKYSLTEETKAMLKQVNDKITIYYLAQTGAELEDFKKIIDNYEKVNNNISVQYKDPVKYPKFTSQFVDDKITEQSFLVVNETNGRAKYVDYKDVLIQELDYNSFTYKTTGIDVEGRIDAAIQYVTNEKLPTVYAISGHGETEISTTMSTMLSKENISTENINTLTSTEIPEDCDMLFINQPQSDYSEEEIELIKDYLEAGGNAIVNVDFVTPDLENFNAFLASYGIELAQGILLEGDSNYYRGNYMNELVPSVSSHEFTEGIKDKKFIVAPVCTGIQISENLKESLTAKPILTTSDKAFSKTNVYSSTSEKESGDIDGPFYLGVEIVGKTEEDEMRLVVYSGKYTFEDSYISTSIFGNKDLLINTINNLGNQENTIRIRTISLAEERLSLTSAQKNRNGAITVVILPALFVIVGVVVTLQRRKR